MKNGTLTGFLMGVKGQALVRDSRSTVEKELVTTRIIQDTSGSWRLLFAWAGPKKSPHSTTWQATSSPVATPGQPG